MTPPVDPNEVMMTGEHSFIRLSADGGKTISDRFSHWRVLWCPDGAGHVLLVDSTLLGGQPRIYSDNPAVARWLQKNTSRSSIRSPPTRTFRSCSAVHARRRAATRPRRRSWGAETAS